MLGRFDGVGLSKKSGKSIVRTKSLGKNCGWEGDCGWEYGRGQAQTPQFEVGKLLCSEPP